MDILYFCDLNKTISAIGFVPVRSCVLDCITICNYIDRT